MTPSLFDNLKLVLFMAVFYALVFGGIFRCVRRQAVECEARACPEGTSAVHTHDGCFCLVRPR